MTDIWCAQYRHSVARARLWWSSANVATQGTIIRQPVVVLWRPDTILFAIAGCCRRPRIGTRQNFIRGKDQCVGVTGVAEQSSRLVDRIMGRRSEIWGVWVKQKMSEWSQESRRGVE
ncbi:hypothetical protein B0H13DRAFT_1891439 [Mycena leptocephala]|nr:hypothetical protein B0H13DRAFT_1891439 [Mycena leptocephala]